MKHGIRCSYVLISALSYVIKEVCNDMQGNVCTEEEERFS